MTAIKPSETVKVLSQHRKVINIHDRALAGLVKDRNATVDALIRLTLRVGWLEMPWIKRLFINREEWEREQMAPKDAQAEDTASPEQAEADASAERARAEAEAPAFLHGGHAPDPHEMDGQPAPKVVPFPSKAAKA